MFYPRYEHRHIVCDHPSCFRSISGLGFRMLLTLAKAAKWRIVEDGSDFWHFCSKECMEDAKQQRDRNRRVLHGARAWKMGAFHQREERDKERMEVEA